jgi:hypothetical protein
MAGYADGHHPTTHPSHPGRTHILPQANDSFGYWLKAIVGIVSIITAVVLSTIFLVKLPTSAENATATLKTEFQAQATYNAQTFETKQEAAARQAQLDQRLDRIESAVNEAAKNTALIMGALGIKPLK